MPLGDHGNKVLVPLTGVQKFASFPWGKFYRNSMYFRVWCGTALGLASVWTYIALKGVDVSFTPYSAVHHSIGHKFAHDLEHLRYPIEHHHDNKKH